MKSVWMGQIGHLQISSPGMMTGPGRVTASAEINSKRSIKGIRHTFEHLTTLSLTACGRDYLFSQPKCLKSDL